MGYWLGGQKVGWHGMGWDGGYPAATRE